MYRKNGSTFNSRIVWQTTLQSIRRLTPSYQWFNPVMFVVYVGTLLTTYYVFTHPYNGFNVQIVVWLWLTVFFANFAHAMAESRGKAQARSLRQAQVESFARLMRDGVEVKVPAAELKKGDIIVCENRDIIPADGEVIEGIATVDESAITGESAPVIRESGGDRSAVTVGTRVVSDRIVVRVTSESGQNFLDRMIALVEGAKRKKTPNEVALNIVLSALTIIFLMTVVSLKFYADYSIEISGQDAAEHISVPILVALLVCLIPTTIGALLSAVGIAGMDRLIQRNVIVHSGRCVEAAGDIDLLLLDKTGTITLGNRMAAEFIPVKGVDEKNLAEIAQISSLSDETPEGRSIVVLAKTLYNLRGESLDISNSRTIPFSAKSKMSGIDIIDATGKVVRKIRKGAAEAIKAYVIQQGGIYPEELTKELENIGMQGGTPLLVADDAKILGIIHLKDVVKGGIKERFAEMRKIGIRTIMITGDNYLTAAAIAAEAGVDDFIAEATPEHKLLRIREAQKSGQLVAMTGDGTNDAPALAQADVGVAMNTGTQASREAGNMVDLESNPTKLIDIVEIGKQMLITRGALTTFSIANDLAKYFAIIPALFRWLYATNTEEIGPLSNLNIMHLHSPKSAILSCVIFNALIIFGLIPLALRGVKYKTQSANELLRKNILFYGLGGLIVPFIGIKIIDKIIVYLGWV